jgi:hypothetical protein
MNLQNMLNEDVLLQFTNTCRMTYWVADSLGNIVFDTLAQSNCNNAEYDMVLAPSEQSMFACKDGLLRIHKAAQCLLEPMFVVAEVPEFGLLLPQSRLTSDEPPLRTVIPQPTSKC